MKLNRGDSLIAKKQKQRLNNDITSTEVRLISEDGEQLGVVAIDVAIKKAQDAGLDLMEVAPVRNRPCAKLSIMAN